MADISSNFAATKLTVLTMPFNKNETVNINSQSSALPSDINQKLVITALNCLATNLDGKSSFPEIDSSMTKFANQLNDQSADNPADKASLEKVFAGGQQVSLARDNTATLSNDVTIKQKSALLVNATANQIAVIRAHTGQQELRAKFSTNQTTAKFFQAASGGDDSYREMWDRLAASIGNIKKNYVDHYAKLMKTYTELYEAFNKHVQKAAAEAVTSGEDGNTISFNNTTMAKGFDDFKGRKKALEKELGTIPGWGNMSTADKEIAKVTYAPAFKIDDDGNIKFNMDVYDSVPWAPAGIDENNKKVSTSGYQAWAASLNAASTSLQSNMQAFAQRYSQANSIFDNLNKILSSAISALAEVAKEALRSL